jgi:hypothetical protein
MSKRGIRRRAKPRFARFVKRDDVVSFRRDVREKRP